MKFIVQISLVFLLWSNNLANATPVIVRVIFSGHEVIISKAENENEEALRIVGTQLKNKFECVKEGGLVYLVVTTNSYEEAVHIASKCLLGVDMTVAEWNVMYDKITTYIGKNWDDPYLHGQAAVFVASLAVPVTKLSKFSKLKLLNRLKANTKFADKVDDLAKISKVADEGGDVGKVVDEFAKGVDFPSSLVSKLTQQGSAKLKSWIGKTKINYKGLSGAEAEVKIFDDMGSKLADQNVLEVVEDAQGRFLVRTDTKVYGLHDNVSGTHDIFEYSQPYRKTDFPLSANKLAPDFATTSHLHPLTGNQKNIVKIKMQGSYPKDFEEANKLSGILSSSPQKAPDGYVWHHLDDFNPETGEC